MTDGRTDRRLIEAIDNTSNRLINGTDGRLRFHPSRCNARAEAFSAKMEWSGIAVAAFDNWVEEVREAFPSFEGCLFLADSGLSWLICKPLQDKARGGAADHMETLRTSVERAIRSGQVPSAADAGFQIGNIRTVALYAADGKAALVAGAVSTCNTTGIGRWDAARIRELSLHYISLVYYHGEKAAKVRLAELQQETEREINKKDMVYQIAYELSYKIDVDDILADVINRVKTFFPALGLEVFMTQDSRATHLDVKPLHLLRMEHHSCVRAFMEGDIVIDRGGREGKHEMAVPLSGKQGVYGVICLYDNPGPFEHADIQLMKVLSSAAGTAFENAKLFEHSNLLVNELRLINDLTKQLNQSLKLGEIFDFASAELVQIFNADFCCMLELDPDKHKFVVRASNLPAMFHENFDASYGFSGLVFTSREPVIVSDYEANTKVKSKLMDLTGSRSLIAAPIIVNGEVQGVILVAHRLPGYFTYDNYKLLQVLSGHIGLALANASLHAEVRRMVITDNLTGLYARHFLDEQVGLLQKKDFCGSLIVVDIDNFKKVNDTFGHQTGDRILIQVSSIIRSSIRESDIPARWGGEELAIYLPQVTTKQAMQIAERIRSRVQKETDPAVTVSCGVSEWKQQDERISVEALFYRSDMALYKAKHEGKNRINIG